MDIPTPTTEYRYREVTEGIIGAAIEVHRALGPGLLESAYCACLAHEFTMRGMRFLREVFVDIDYKSLHVPNAYRVDFVVEESVVLEVKAVEALGSAHEAQVLTSLKLMKRDVGLLLNFNEPTLKKGIKRLILSSRFTEFAPDPRNS